MTAFLYYHDYSYSAYGYMVVCTALVVNLVMWQYLNPAKWVAMRFYTKHKLLKVTEQAYDVDAEKLHSVLYCAGYHRMMSGGSIERYKEMMLSACMDNPKMASSIVKYLEPYKVDTGSLVCYLADGRFFVDLKEDNENGSTDNSDGDFEELDSGSDDIRSSDGEQLRDEEDEE